MTIDRQPAIQAGGSSQPRMAFFERRSKPFLPADVDGEDASDDVEEGLGGVAPARMLDRHRGPFQAADGCSLLPGIFEIALIDSWLALEDGIDGLRRHVPV